jgi:hypothetical protein
MSFFADLASQIRSSDLSIATQRHEVQRRLVALRDGVPAEASDLTGFFDAALALVSMLPVLDERAGSEVARITKELVDLAMMLVAPLSARPQVAPPAATSASPRSSGEGGDLAFGQLLVEFGFASAKDVARAVSQQAITPDRPIGQILVDAGALTSRDQDFALRLQRQLQRGAVEDLQQRRSAEELKLGNLMLRRGFITPETLADALRAQQARGGRLGEILVGMAAVTWDQVKAALTEQKAGREHPGKRTS